MSATTTCAHLGRALARTGLPLVLVDPMDMPTTPIISVGSTNFRGGLDAARHLIRLGHRRIAFLGGLPTADCNQARLQGFRAALEAEGIGFPDEYARSAGDFSYATGGGRQHSIARPA